MKDAAPIEFFIVLALPNSSLAQRRPRVCQLLLRCVKRSLRPEFTPQVRLLWRRSFVCRRRMRLASQPGAGRGASWVYSGKHEVAKRCRSRCDSPCQCTCKWAKDGSFQMISGVEPVLELL